MPEPPGTRSRLMSPAGESTRRKLGECSLEHRLVAQVPNVRGWGRARKSARICPVVATRSNAPTGTAPVTTKSANRSICGPFRVGHHDAALFVTPEALVDCERLDEFDMWHALRC